MFNLARITKRLFRRNGGGAGNCPISFSSRARKKLHWTSFISHNGF